MCFIFLFYVNNFSFFTFGEKKKVLANVGETQSPGGRRSQENAPKRDL